jgi:hypothetical protein
MLFNADADWWLLDSVLLLIGAGFSDPYCYVWAEPSNGSPRLCTRTVVQNLNPVWNESFELYVSSIRVVMHCLVWLIIPSTHILLHREVDTTANDASLQFLLYDYDLISADGMCLPHSCNYGRAG